MTANRTTSNLILNSPGALRPLLVLAWPVLVGQLLDMLVGFTDIWLTGNYLIGDRYLAAMTQTSYVLWLLTGMFSLVSIGAAALIARFIGAQDQTGAHRTLNQAVLLGAVVCLLPVLLMTVFAPLLSQALGLDDETSHLVQRYLWILLPAVPAMMIEQVGVSTLRAAGDTVTGVVAMVLVNVVDMVVSYVLVRGVGPFAELGWDGLAIGTTVGYLVGTLVIVVRLFNGRSGLQIQRRFLLPDWSLVRRILRISIPGGLDTLSLIACHLWFVRIVSALGNFEVAAHGVAIRIESIGYLPALAFQVAVATMVGQLLGANQPRKANHAVSVACITTVVFMSCMATLMLLGSDWMASQFVNEKQENIAIEAASLVRIVAFVQPVLAILMILIGTLRGAGDTRWPLVITFVGLLGVRIPLAYCLAWSEMVLPITGTVVPLVGLGVRGAWYAMVADLSVRCALILLHYRRGKWQKTIV